MSTSTSKLPAWLFRISAVLWVVWGLVHVFAGVMTLRFTTSGQTAEGVQGIANAIELSTLQRDYPPAATAILSQHGFNLGWAGVVTFLCAFWVWRGRRGAVLLAALVGGLMDLGYFLFIDLGGFAAPPGPQMTYICAAAILSGFVALGVRGSGSGGAAAAA